MTRSLGVGLGVAAVAIALVGRPGSSWAMGSSYEKPSVQKSQGQDSRDATRAGAAADSWQVEQSTDASGRMNSAPAGQPVDAAHPSAGAASGWTQGSTNAETSAGVSGSVNAAPSVGISGGVGTQGSAAGAAGQGSAASSVNAGGSLNAGSSIGVNP